MSPFPNGEPDNLLDPLGFDTKKAKRILAGTGQRVTWGRLVPTSIYVKGSEFKRVLHCFLDPTKAPTDIKPDGLYEVSRTGHVREV